MNKLVETILLYIATPILLVLAGIFLGGEVWAKGKIVLGDILKFLGWAGKGIKKLSVASEYEGTINGIIHDYNKNFETPILPNCKIQWVTAENQANILKENEAIICLSFDSRDHNLNFYNATLNFVQTALIAKSKHFLTKASSNAIDLLTTHIILRNNRKEVLTTFGKKLNEFDSETKSEFESLAITNDRGLFLNILLPEFHHYGELVNTLPPSSEFYIEAAGLLQWFKDLATREFDERTNLKFQAKNFKVGVILVAKSETWEKYGVTAYTKWADFYTAEGFSSVYVLAKGSEGFERATAVTKILTQSRGFDQLNRNPKIKCFSSDGTEYYVTCYSLRPNKATIAYLAWESFKDYYEKNKTIPAIVDSVQKDGIIVNAFGLKYELPNNLLSELQIADARKIFRPEDEIYLNITEFDSNSQQIVLSNAGTISDPKHFIESILKENKSYTSKIERIESDRQGIQVGLKVSNKNLKSWVFIPKHKATKSRFLDLNRKYSVGENIEIIIESYNATSSNLVGSVNNLIDPWDDISGIQIGGSVQVAVKQINEFSVVCEISEGLECRFSRNEISWKQEECTTSKYKIDDLIDVKVLGIESDKRLVNVSPKQLIRTPEMEFYEDHKGEIIEAEIVQIDSERGLVIKYPNGLNTGYIHWFEIGWGMVGRFEKVFSAGDKIRVIVYDFDSFKNRIRFSIKRQYQHQFKEWVSTINKNDFIDGEIIEYFESSVHVELTQNGIVVQAFVHRKNISNIAFIEQADLPYYLPVGEIFRFGISEINEDIQSISLTRRDFLESFDDVEYGVQYSVAYVKENHKKGFFYSNDLEGWVNLPVGSIALGASINVMPVSVSNGEFEIN